MEYIKSNCSISSAYLDFAIIAKSSPRGVLLVQSVYDRSITMIKSYLASAMQGYNVYIGETGSYTTYDMIEFEGTFSSLNAGYEKFAHGMLSPKNEDYIICENTDEEMEYRFYCYLMKHFQLPLLPSMSRTLLNQAVLDGLVQNGFEIIGNRERKLQLYNKSVSLSEIAVMYVGGIEEEWLRTTLCELVRTKRIRFTKEEQQELLLTDMDGYYINYGHTIIENVANEVKPLVGLKDKVETLALTSKNLFPQQACVVNGLVRALRERSYLILNEGMGCGKSLQALATVEAYFVNKYLNMHPDKSIKDAYEKSDTISYRIMLMAPGHLLENWKNESKEIPYMKCTVITSLSQLTELKKHPKPKGRELYVLGKDFGKLSYGTRPIPTKVAEVFPKVPVCRRCGEKGESYVIYDHLKCGCSAFDWKLVPSRSKEKVEALLCPECGSPLMDGDTPLMPEDFYARKAGNEKCSTCGCKLWQPDVEPVTSNPFGTKTKEEKWYKISHFKNKAHKTPKETSWVMKEYEYRLAERICLDGMEVAGKNQRRKVAPAEYIKKQLRGYFDFAIFDEVHLLKGGATAQGYAFHSIVKASKKQLLLTGTIAGGYASHLFYTIYRVHPSRMKAYGFEYSDEKKFVEKYGTLETQYAFNGSEGAYNKNSRGKKITETQVKPGISPMIYKDFLLDHSVCLDLSDMSKFLPPYKEQVITCKMSEDISKEYYSVIQQLRSFGSFKNPMLPALMQFSLAYLDKPYGYGKILNPQTGMVAAEPHDFELSEAELLPKEEKLVNLINDELEQGRSIFVFCEFTGGMDKNVTERLRDIITYHCTNKVVILHSDRPSPKEREEWIHKKASQGYRVVICNPKAVETGCALASA